MYFLPQQLQVYLKPRCTFIPHRSAVKMRDTDVASHNYHWITQDFSSFKLILNGPERFSECAPLFRSFPWASQVATEMSRTAAGWKQSTSNRWACGKKLWSLIIKYQQNYDSVSRHLRAQAGISWKAARCGYWRGVTPDNAFISMEKKTLQGPFIPTLMFNQQTWLASGCTLHVM